MIGPLVFLTLRGPLAMFGDSERIDVRQGLTRPSAEPQIMVEEEIRGHHDPEDAAARLVHQLETDLDLIGLAADNFGLELDMAGHAAAGHDQVIATRIEFGAQYLDVGHTQLPQPAQRFTNKDMLDDALAQGRVDEMWVRFLGKIVQSALAQ